MAYTQADLDALRAAKLALAKGQLVASVTFADGRQTRYSDIDTDMLNDMIAEAQAQLDAATGKRRPRQFRMRTSRGL